DDGFQKEASGAKPCKNWLTAGGCSYGSLDRYLPGEGASAALRQGTEQEIESAIPVTVSLPVGEMVMFCNDSGTLLVREPVLPIVPMSALPLLGCEISWSDRGCYVRHPCKEWLGKHLRSDSCGELELQTVAKVLFPDLPEALASQVAAFPLWYICSQASIVGETQWDRTFDPDASTPTSNGLSFRGDEGEERSLLLTFVVSCAKEKVFTCLEMPESSTAWEWPEYENVSVCLGGWTASFDQGTLGPPCSKASAVYTSSFQLYESLHEMKPPPEAVTNLTSDFSGKGWAPGC
ncbi:unnamed protein product, partial [Symbiodinium sp. KB8]